MIENIKTLLDLIKDNQKAIEAISNALHISENSVKTNYMSNVFIPEKNQETVVKILQKQVFAERKIYNKSVDEIEVVGFVELKNK